MTETTRTGFDAPAARDEDVLERWPFAERVYSLIKETPDDWSVRVAVLGPWGSGKSTVLDYVGELATADNFIVVRFNPWGFATPTEMFAELLGALGYEIEKHGEDRPRVEQLKAAIAKGRKKLSLAVEVIGGAAAVVSAGIAPAAGAKAVEKAVPLLTQAIAGVAPTASDIGKVAANAHRRVVVLLDDLDRADPATVKPLLWALRQLFDEAGLAFVLAIDPVRRGEIVTSAHGVQDGQDFLEKIIDFPRSLPTATNAQVAALARRDLRRWCPSLVPAVEEASAHLPRNPRKVRQIVRQLITVRTTLARFGDGEVDLVAFVLLSICRARWPLLAHVVLRDSEAAALLWLCPNEP